MIPDAKTCCSLANASVVDACSTLTADEVNTWVCKQGSLAFNKSEEDVQNPALHCLLKRRCQDAG